MNHSGTPDKKYKFTLATLEQHLNDYMTYGFSTVPPPEAQASVEDLILTDYDLGFLKDVGVKA